MIAPAPPAWTRHVFTLILLSLLFGPSFAAARKNPTPKNLAARNLSVAFLAVSLLFSGAYALGKDMAQRDNHDHTLCKP
jgi:hypothetical protein